MAKKTRRGTNGRSINKPGLGLKLSEELKVAVANILLTTAPAELGIEKAAEFLVTNGIDPQNFPCFYEVKKEYL